MLKLLRNLRRQEWAMAAVCAVLILGQIYFDLALPDYMSSLTVLIKTPGSTLSDILHTGLEMLGCTLASAVLCVICGYLTAKVAAGFSFSIREAVFHKIADFGQQEMMTFSVPSLINRTTNDITQVQMLTAMGLQILIKSPIMAVWAIIKIVGKSWTLSAITAGFVAALLVMMVVIIGIVVTFAGSGLIERWRVAREVRATMLLVHAELETNRADFMQVWDYQQWEMRACKFLTDNRRDLKRIPSDTLASFDPVYGRIHFFHPRRDAFEVLKNSGLMSSVPDKDFLLAVTQGYAVLADLEENDAMLISFLRGTRAYCDGKRVLFECSDAFRDYIRNNREVSKRLKETIYRVSRTKYSIGPYEEPKTDDTTAAVSLDETLHTMQALGVDLKIVDK